MGPAHLPSLLGSVLAVTSPEVMTFALRSLALECSHSAGGCTGHPLGCLRLSSALALSCPTGWCYFPRGSQSAQCCPIHRRSPYAKPPAASCRCVARLNLYPCGLFANPGGGLSRPLLLPANWTGFSHNFLSAVTSLLSMALSHALPCASACSLRGFCRTASRPVPV